MNELNNKKGNISTVIIVVLLMVIIGLGFYVACDKGLIFSNDNNNEEIDNNENVDSNNNGNHNDENKVPVGETKITDSTIIDALNNNVDIISQSSLGCSPSIIENLYINDVENSNVSIEDKLLITLNSIDKVVEGPESSKKIYAKTVEEQIYKLFGETKNIKHKNFSWCPIYTYNENQKTYTYSYACGGGCPVDFMTYTYNYSVNDNKYYVYQSLGRQFLDDESDNLIIYGNYEKSKIVKKGTYEEMINFQLNESNYQDFSAYKWTFIKDSEGNYIFDSLVRIK